MDMASTPCCQHMGVSRRQTAQLDCVTKLILIVALDLQPLRGLSIWPFHASTAAAVTWQTWFLTSVCQGWGGIEGVKSLAG